MLLLLLPVASACCVMWLTLAVAPCKCVAVTTLRWNDLPDAALPSIETLGSGSPSVKLGSFSADPATWWRISAVCMFLFATLNVWRSISRVHSTVVINVLLFTSG